MTKWKPHCPSLSSFAVRSGFFSSRTSTILTGLSVFELAISVKDKIESRAVHKDGRCIQEVVCIISAKFFGLLAIGRRGDRWSSIAQSALWRRNGGCIAFK